MTTTPLFRTALITLAAFALSGGLAMSPAQAAEIEIAAPILPPHVTEAGEGREVSVIRESLEACGHTARFETFPFGTHWKRYRKQDGFDAVTTAPARMDLPGATSDSYIEYQNGVSFLEKRDLSIDSVADLEGLDIVTFQDGLSILGLEDQREAFGKVREIADQEVHSRVLFGERVDVVLSDGLIFAAFNEKLRTERNVAFDIGQPVRFKAVVPPVAYRMAFRDPEIRNDFNRCFAELRDTGRIEAINKDYIARYRDVVGDQYLGY